MDHGITHKFVKDLKREVEPGTSALILLGASDPERRLMIEQRLLEFDPRVMESDLPPEVQQEIEQECEGRRAA